MTTDWLPREMDELADLLQNFVDHEDLLTTGLGLNEDEVQDLLTQLKAWLEVHAAIVKLRDKLAGLVKTQHDSLEDFTELLRKLVRQIKNSPKATNEILADLHLLAPSSTSGAARTKAKAKADKPMLKLTLASDGVEIDFIKHGHGALALYCRRGDETTFTLVSTYTTRPIYDRRPNLVPGQAEHREYQGQYQDRDQPVGQLSDTASIAVAPNG